MEDLAIIIDARPLRFYPGWVHGAFSGGTETYVKQLAFGLEKRGHIVHVITADLAHEEQFGPRGFFWGPEAHPRMADVVLAASTLETVGDLAAPVLVLLPNGIDPLLFSNDPARGLLQTLDIFERVRAEVPEAELHIGYDFDRQFEQHKWSARTMAEILWECKRRIETTPGVVSLGGLNHADLVRETRECHVYAYPSDPPNTGSQIHGMLQMELAAAGCPLVLSDIEAFPEVFGDGARLLPVIGAMRKHVGDAIVRVDAQDWAEVVVELMRSPKKWKAASASARALAERHTWDAMGDRFEVMLGTLMGRLNSQQETMQAA